MTVNLLKSIASSYEQFEAIFNGNKVPSLFKVFKDIVGSCTDSTKACVCLRLFNLCSTDAPEALLQFNDFLPADYAFIAKSAGPGAKPLVLLPKALEEHSRTCPNDHGATHHPNSHEDENVLMYTIESLLPADSSLEFKHLIIAFSSQQVEAVEFIMYSTYLMKEYPEFLTCLMFYLTPSWKKFSYKSLNIVPLEQMGAKYGLSQDLSDDEYMRAILYFVSNSNLLSQNALEWRTSVIQSISSSLNEMMAKSPKLFDHTRTTVLNLMVDNRTKEVYQPFDDQAGLPPQMYRQSSTEYGVPTGASAGSLRAAPGKAAAKDKSIKPYKAKSGSNSRSSDHWSLGRNTIGSMRSILLYEGAFGAEFKNLAELAQHTESYFLALLHAKELPRHAILSYRIPCCRVFLIDVCETLLNSNALPLMKDSYAAAKMHKYGLVDSFTDYGVVPSNFDMESHDETDKGKTAPSTALSLEYFTRRQEYLRKVQLFMKRYVSLPLADQYLLITRKHNEAITFIENAFFCQLKYNLRGLFALASLNEVGDSRPLSYAWQQVTASYIKANSQMNYPCRITVDDSFLVYMQLTHSMHIQEILESYPSIGHKACRGLLAQRTNKEILDQHAPFIERRILSTRDIYENFLFFSNDRNFDTISQIPQSWSSAINYILFYSGSGNYTTQNIHTHNMISIQQTAQIAEGISTGTIPSYSQWFTQTGDMLLPLDIPVMSIATESNLTTFEMRVNRLSMEERNRISAANIPECNTSYRFKHPVRLVRQDSVLNKYYYGTFPMGSESSAKSIRQMNVSQLMEDNRKIVQSTDDIAGLEEELIKYDVVIYNLKLIEQKLQVFCSKYCPNLLRIECNRNYEGAHDVLYEGDCQFDDMTFETVKKRESVLASGSIAKEMGGSSHTMESSCSDPYVISTVQEPEEVARNMNEPEIKKLVAPSPTSPTNHAEPEASLLPRPSERENSDPVHGEPSIPMAAPKLLIKNEATYLPDIRHAGVSVKREEELGVQGSAPKDPADGEITCRNTVPDSPIAAHITARFLQHPQETSIYPLSPGNAAGSQQRHRSKLSTTDIQREVMKDMELGQTACLDLPLPCLETIKSVIGLDYYDLFLRHPKTSAPFVLKRLRVFLRDLQSHRNLNQSPLIIRKLRTCSLRNLDHLSNGQAEIDKKAFVIRNMFADFELKQKNSYYISDTLLDRGHYDCITSEFVLKPEIKDPTDDDQMSFWDKLMSISDACPTLTKFWHDEEQCPEERFREQRKITQDQLIHILSSQAYPGCYCSCSDRLSNVKETPISDTGLSLLNKLKIVVDAMYAQARQKLGLSANPAQHKCYFLPHIAFNIRHIKPEALQFLKTWLLHSHSDTPSSAFSATVDDGLQEDFFNAVFGQILYADRDVEMNETQSASIVEFMTYILLRFAYSVLTRLSIARQICEEVRPGVSAETLQFEVLRKFGLVDPFDPANPRNAYEYSILFMNLLNAIPGNIVNCADIDQIPTQSLGAYFTEKEIAEALDSAKDSFQPGVGSEARDEQAKSPRTDLYWLIVQWYILTEKVSQEQFEFDMSALLGSSVAVIFNLKPIMKNMRKIYTDIFTMYAEVHRIHASDGIFKGNTVDANMISAVLLYIQHALKINMLAEQSGELLSRTLLCDIANKRGSGIMLCEVVAGCMCFTELFDVKPMP